MKIFVTIKVKGIIQEGYTCMGIGALWEIVLSVLLLTYIDIFIYIYIYVVNLYIHILYVGVYIYMEREREQNGGYQGTKIAKLGKCLQCKPMYSIVIIANDRVL